ncbi:hypothetical protein DERF_005738 [Dermatophagoides farinae]|uniref:Uncharacterized protein n=1 Tax=Dermatophagoides farinae TaxID=6954 RepID=A0A922IA37_DERFA|nr:hypothetical protein DERF_005738 [Dermatophagoides farinae]
MYAVQIFLLGLLGHILYIHKNNIIVEMGRSFLSKKKSFYVIIEKIDIYQHFNTSLFPSLSSKNN